MLSHLKTLHPEDAAKWSAELLCHAAKHGYSDLMKVQQDILLARPYDPVTRNAVSFITHLLSKKDILLSEVHDRVEHVKHYFDMADERIGQFGCMRIKRGAVIATFGSSLTVLQMLLHAKREGKKFIVHVLHSHGLGKGMAKELSQQGIKVVYFEDASARLCLKNADVLFLGAHALTQEGHVIGTIGSELMAETALSHQCKVYVACHGWKYDSTSVFRHDIQKEFSPLETVWDSPPKGVVMNRYAFETVNDRSLSGVISEVGVHRPGYFVKEVSEKYPWMKQSFLSKLLQ